ncbi:O-antigen ligase family protein [Priestia flexa]|uniref:O-antigen ligase family protein n=1 Tax=Priestia flexa TaxID=86664 RepID=UPI000473A1D4|nr:O-antigen ligase family protein [Priestia flexa]
MIKYQINRRKPLTFNLVTIICSICCLFLISTLTQALIPFPINQILGSLLLLALLIVQLIPKTTWNFILVIVYLTVPTFITLAMTLDFSLAVIEVVRYISCFLLFFFIMRKDLLKEVKRYFKEYKKFVRAIVLLGNGILLFCFFQDACYSYQWGEERYFIGYTSFYHTMASACCLLIVIAMLHIQQHNVFKIYRVLYILIPTLAIFFTGARTFLISLAILMIIFIRVNIKKQVFRQLSYLVAAIIGGYTFYSSSMFEKFAFAMDNQYVSNSMDSFTSGRNDLWRVAINSFQNDNLLFQLLGRGFTYSYSLNREMTGQYIWSHSDLFNILICGGLLGIFVYSYTLIKVARNMVKITKKRYKAILLMCYIIIPALLNGFYEYQHYVISALLLYIYLLIHSEKTTSNKLSNKL